MIQGEDIICISNTTWFGEYTKSTVQIMSRLAKNNRVIFVEYPFTMKDLLFTFLGKQSCPAKRMLGIGNRLTSIKTENDSEVYHLVVPPVLPVDFIKNDAIFNSFFNINIAVYLRQIRKILKKLNVKNPVVITAYNPFYGLPLVGKLNEKLNIYYCYDGIGTRRHGKRIFPVDEQFSKLVDAIITTSEYLNKGKLLMNPSSFVVKNGVDFPVFGKFAKSAPHVGNIRKKVGYIGSLDHRFDIDTVEFAVKHLQDVDFEFTGSLRNPQIKSLLEKYPNVKFRNAVAPAEVPELLAQCDAGIIPYIADEMNKNIYPLKINEYFAVGVPVIMTPFTDLPEFSALISVSENKEDFAEKIRHELQNDSVEKIQKRIQFAESNSWDSKTEEFSGILQKFLNHGNN